MKYNIIIITHNFPPLNKIGSYRPHSWAKYWARMGHNVRVITTLKMPYDGQLTENKFICKDNNFIVEELPYWPFAQRRKENVLKMTNLKPGNSYDTRISKIKYIVRRLRNIIGSLPDIHDPWIIPAYKRCMEIYKKEEYNIVISTYSPPCCHIVGGLLKRNLNVFWVADYRDLWSDNHINSGKWPFCMFEEYVEKYFVKKSDLITTVSEPLKNRLKEKYGDKVITIENGFDTEDLKDIENEPYFPKDGKIRIVYTGTIYPKKRDPSPLFHAIKRMEVNNRELHKKVEVLFFGDDISNLLELVNKWNVKNYVKTPGQVDRRTSLRIQRSADILLFLESNEPSVDGILTGKLFEYMFSGRPILALGIEEKSTAGRLILDAGIGVVVGKDIEKIKELIKELINGGNIIYNPKIELIKKYTRENLAKKMLDEISIRLK